MVAAGLSFITVVSGLPRSGTSLMMQALGAGGVPLLTDAARAPDEDNPRGYFEYEPARRLDRDASWLEGAVGHAVKIVCPLATQLPDGREYRILVMRRDLREVLASQRAMLTRRGGDTGQLSQERLVAIFRSQLFELSRWANGRAGVRVLDVEFGALLAQPARVVEAVNRFLGGGLDTDAMAAAVEPALRHQRASAT